MQVPTQVQGVSNAVHVVAGLHSCAISADGAVRCWGGNDDGQLGDADADGNVAGLPRGPKNAIDAWGSSNNLQDLGGTCIATGARELWCWGDVHNADGPTPTQVPGYEDVQALGGVDGIYLQSGGVIRREVDGVHEDWLTGVDLVAEHCAAKDDGTVWCWGPNQTGGHGNGTLEESETPVQVTASWLDR